MPPFRWSSCAHLYLDTPARRFPALMPVADRIADLGDGQVTGRADA